METTLPNEFKRWTAARRTDLVLQILRGETTANEAARQYDLKPSEIIAWQETFLAGLMPQREEPEGIPTMWSASMWLRTGTLLSLQTRPLGTLQL